MRPQLLLAGMLALACLAAAAPPVLATQAAAPASAAADALLAALNGGHEDRVRFAERFTAAALKREDAASRVRALDSIAAAAGGFTLIERGAGGPRLAELIVRTNRGGRFGRIVLFTSRTEPERVSDLFILSERDPAQAKRFAWPGHAVAPARIAREIDRRVTALTREDLFSGVILVAHRDRVLLQKGYGFANLEWRAPNRAGTLFHTASVGKMFTAVALLRLVEQGRVSLDDHLVQWVPGYPHRDAAAKITLRDLLSHRAALGQWDVRRSTAATALAAATEMTDAPGGDPGKTFAYSNAGYVLIGAVIEAVTGKPFDQAIAELVFTPAEMRAAGFPPVTAIVPNRATGYLRPESDPLGFDPRRSNTQYLGWRGDASGGAYASADDLFRFHRALAAGKLLAPATLDQAFTPIADFAGAPAPWKYGLGFRLADCAGVATIGHSGGGANSGVSNATYSTRDGAWTVIVLSNYDPVGEALAADICAFVNRN